MSAPEICAILNTSAQAGVFELSFEGLHVKFGRPAEKVNELGHLPSSGLPYPFMPQYPTALSSADLTEEQHKTQGRDSLEMDEVRMREQQLAMALVENPELYEELLLKEGELTHAMDGADGPIDEEDV